MGCAGASNSSKPPARRRAGLCRYVGMRRAVRYLAVLGGGLLALGLAGYALAPRLIERAILAELAGRGIDAVQLEVALPRIGSLSARQVRIGTDGAFTADEVLVSFRIAELLDGRIGRIRLVRPHLMVAVSAEGEVSLGGLDPLFQGARKVETGGTSEKGGALALPAPIEIVDGTVTAATAAGEVSARLEGTIALEPGAGPLTLTLAGPWLTADLSVAMSQSDAGISLSGEVTDARISHPLISAAMRGPFAATLGTDEPALSVDLGLAEIASPLLTIAGGAAAGSLSLRAGPDDVVADLRLAASGGRFDASIQGDPGGRLQVVLGGAGLTVPDAVSQASVDAVIDLYPREQRAALAGPARLEGIPGPDLRAALPQSIQATIANSPVSMTADPGLEVSRSATGIAVSGAVALAQPGALTARFDGSFSQTTEGWSGYGETRFESASLALPHTILRELSLEAPIRLTHAEGRTEIHLTGAAPLSLASVEFGATRLTALTATLQEGDRPLLSFGPDGSQIALLAGPGRTSGRLGRSREPFTLRWQGASLDSRPGIAMTATVSGGRAALSRLGWEAHGMSARIAAEAAAPPEVRLTVSRLGQSGEEPTLAPIAIEGTLHPTGDGLRFDVRCRDATGQVRFALTGDHDFARNRGRSSLVVDPVRFAPGELQPGAVIRTLGGVMREVAGTLSADGTLTWSDQGLTGDIVLLVQKLSFLTSFGPVIDLEGRVRLNGLAPLSTPPGQRLTATALQAALPMSDLALRFGYRQGRYVDVEEGGLGLAGGRVTIPPTTLDLEARRNTVGLEVADVQLPILFDLIGLNGLSGTGRLAGRIPIAFQDRDVAIVGGRLESQEPGEIRYDPEEPPSALQGGGQSVELALAALRNFQYDRLILELDREIGGETQVKLHIAGRNPDFYGGHPVEFNLNLTGKLDRMLVEGLAGYRVYQTLQDRLRQSSGETRGSTP